MAQFPISRRSLLAAVPLALTGCQRAEGQPARSGPIAPLKSVATFPVGTCVMTAQLDDPGFTQLLLTHFSQITPEWEMKMEYILQPDRSYRWDAPDRLAAFARKHGIRLYGTTLVWHQENPEAFKALAGDRAAFAGLYHDYIFKVADRYRGQAVGWDVVNEPVAEDGDGLRDCIWSQALGAEDYMVRAFEHAKEADPGAVLFINDYNLEALPRKRATFLRLVERLLARGAPVGGIGTQTHLGSALPSGALATSMRELAQFGLPIHVSELDFQFEGGGLRSRADKLQTQARYVAEAAEAYMSLPARQQFAFTSWGIRDRDSWLARQNKDGAGDSPLLFDDQGRPKPAFDALAARFAAGRA